MEGKGQNWIVDDDHTLKVAVENDVQVFDVEVIQLDTVLPVEPLLEYRVVWIDVVKDLVCILLLSCSEHHQFVPLLQFFQNILHVWSETNLDLSSSKTKLECRLEAVRDVPLKLCCYKCLIHIEDEGFVFSFVAKRDWF